MSKTLLACALLISLTACEKEPPPAVFAPAPRTYAGDNPIFDDMGAETVILLENKDDPRFYCAGVWINATTILTAKHCIAAHDDISFTLFMAHVEMDLDDIRITFAQRGSPIAHRGHSFASNDKGDLAMIDVSHPPPHRWARIARRYPKQGDDIHIMGHPDSFKWTYIRGVMAARVLVENDEGAVIPTLQLAAAGIYHGNSGGGAFDAYGNLVGICSTVSRNVATQTHFTDSDAIKLYLDTHRVSYDLD